ncbi:MAG: alpha/beta hydrolase [Chloroflexota bacterium]
MKKGCFRFVIYFVLLLVLLVGYWSWSTNRQIAASEQFEATAAAPGMIVNLHGYDIHVQTLGEPTNPPLVLLHGFGVHAGLFWGEFAELLAEDSFVIVPDMLGFGHSERVTEPNRFYTHAGQAQLVADLLAELKIQTADILGTSYGGGVAAQLALDRPQRVNRLVLIAPQVYDLGGGFFETLGTLPLGVGRALTWSAQGAGPLAQQLASLGCDGDGYCPPEAELAQRQRLAEIEGTTDAFMAITNTPRDARFPAELSSIGNQTLIVWGTADSILAYDEYAQRLADELPNARLVALDGVGHAPYKDVVGETAVLVNEFLH